MDPHKRLYGIYRVIRTLGLFLVSWLVSYQSLYCQSFSGENGRPYIQNFSNLDYDAHAQNWTIDKGTNGLLYVGNTDGLLEYDGVRWRTIFPRTVKSLDIDENGRIYIGMVEDFGYMETDSIGGLYYVSLRNKIDSLHGRFFSIWHVRCQGDRVVFKENSNIYIYHAIEDTVKVLKSSGSNTLFDVGDQIYIYDEVRGLARLGENSLHPVADNGYLGNGKIHQLFPKVGNRWVGRIYSDYFWFERDKRTPLISEAIEYLMTNIAYCMKPLPGNRFGFGTLWGGLVVLNDSGEWVQTIDQSVDLLSNTISNLYLDDQNGLWLTMVPGIARVDIRQAYSILDDSHGLSTTARIMDIVRFNDQLVLGAGVSELYFLEKESEAKGQPHFRQKRSGGIEVWSLLSFGESLLVGTSRGVYEIRDTTNGNKISDQVAYSMYRSAVDPSIVYVGQNNGIRMLRFENGEWKAGEMVPGVPFSTRQIAQSEDGYLWLSTGNHGIVKVDPVGKREGRHYTQEDGIPIDKTSYADIINGDIIFSTARGFFRINKVTGNVEPDTILTGITGINPRSVYVPYQGKDSIFYLTMDEAVGELIPYNGSYKVRKFPIPNSLLGRIFVILPEENGIIWIGGEYGLIRYDTSIPLSERNFKTVIRSVKLNGDSVIYSGSAPLSGIRTVDYVNNSVSFEFAGLFYEHSRHNLYRYFLEGLEEGWSDWTTTTDKEYVRLWEGEYTFKVQAKNIYGTLGTIDSFEFRIMPPWHRTVWAYIGYLLMGVLAFRMILKWRFAYLEKERKRLEDIVEERTTALAQQKKELEEAFERLKKTQSQLVQSEKMASLGVLTSGVAHEINNPVNFVKNGIDALNEEFDRLLSFKKRNPEYNKTAGEMKELVQSIRNGALRTAEIIKSLRTFSRLDEDDLKEYNIENNIKSTLLILNAKMNGKIKVVEDYCDISTVEVYPGKMNQVLMNVLDNAIQAVLSGKGEGTIQITTKKVDEGIRIMVSDDGPGIHPDHVEKIFDPFFTTKEVGKGTGLGLAISHSIIEEHGGKIRVESEVGKGTDLIIELPLHRPIVRMKLYEN